jgi:hypothetical protein
MALEGIRSCDGINVEQELRPGQVGLPRAASGGQHQPVIRERNRLSIPADRLDRACACIDPDHRRAHPLDADRPKHAIE